MALTALQKEVQGTINELSAIAKSVADTTSAGSKERQAKGLISKMADKLVEFNLEQYGVDKFNVATTVEGLTSLASELAKDQASADYDKDTVAGQLKQLAALAELNYLATEQVNEISTIKAALSSKRVQQPSKPIEGRAELVSIYVGDVLLTTQKGNIPSSASNLKHRVLVYCKANDIAVDEAGEAAILAAVRSVCLREVSEVTVGSFTFGEYVDDEETAEYNRALSAEVA